MLCCNTINVIMEKYAAVRDILMEARDISLLMEEGKETYSWKQQTYSWKKQQTYS